jgi:hypothetical protein
MSQKTRILIVVVVLVLVAVVLAAIGFAAQNRAAHAPASTPQSGMIHLYVDGAFAANVMPADLKALSAASFVDKEQGKTQSGYWLRDVIRVYVKEAQLSPQSQITVTGVRQGTEKKSATITWAETLDPANNILFAPSNDGQSVKVASTMEGLATRNDWIQGITEINVKTK